MHYPIPVQNLNVTSRFAFNILRDLVPYESEIPSKEISLKIEDDSENAPPSTPKSSPFIPETLRKSCKGVAIFSLCRVGFLFNATVGDGLIVARLPTGKWSSPSSFAVGGIGLGPQIGGMCVCLCFICSFSYFQKQLK